MNHGRDDRDEQRPSNHSIIGTFGVAVAITAGLAVVVLASFSAATHDEYTEALVIAAATSLAGLGFGLWGLATDRSDRRAAAAKAEQLDREFEREQWESEQFTTLHAADASLANGLRELRVEVHEAREQSYSLLERVRELTEMLAIAQQVIGRLQGVEEDVADVICEVRSLRSGSAEGPVLALVPPRQARGGSSQSGKIE